MEAAVRKGRKLPEWFLDEPQADDTDWFYTQCFWDLDTERHYQYGPIPISRILEYGCNAGLEGDMLNVFRVIIRAMDVGHGEWTVAQIDRQRAAGQQGNRTVQK